MKKVKFSKKAAALVVASVMLVGGVGAGTLAWLTDSTKVVENKFTDSSIKVHLEEPVAEANNNTYNFKMIPGHTIAKDPYAWVSENSEDCYLFIEVKEEGSVKVSTTNDDGTTKSTTCTLSDFIAYKIDEYDKTKNPNGWHELGTGYPGVYYKVIDSNDKKGNGAGSDNKPTKHKILAGDSVTIKNVEYEWNDNEVLTLPTVTKEMMIYAESNKPTLSFTAYAVQLWKTNKPEKGANETDEAFKQRLEDAQFTPDEAWCQVAPSSTGTPGN